MPSALSAHERAYLERQIPSSPFARPFKGPKSADQIPASFKRFCHSARQIVPLSERRVICLCITVC